MARSRLRAPLAIGAFVLLVILLTVTAGAALAQCPMCGPAAEQAGTSPGAAKRAFLTGVLFLLVPALSVFGGIASVVVRRVRAEAEAEREKDARSSS
jgi:hypothetical protein